MAVSVASVPSLALGTPTKVVDCAKLGLNEGFGREFAIGIDPGRFIWTKSAISSEGRIDVRITVVENWAKEFRK